MPQNNDAWTFLVTPSHLLLTREYSHLLAIKLKGLGLSRQKSIDWLYQRLFVELDRPVHHFDGRPFIVHPTIIDEAYGWSDEYRWNTDQKRFALYLPKRVPNAKNKGRLQLWDLGFKIEGDPIIF